MLFVLGAVAVVHASGPVDLTKAKFQDLVVDSGKNAFIKFFAPWCGHCKAAKPVWDRLGGDYESSASVLIGDVDCTVETDLCSDFGVRGYPTIKYFTAETGKDGETYSGPREYDVLNKFIKEKLEVLCSVQDPSSCSDKERSFMEKMQERGPEAVTAQITRLEIMMTGKMKAELRTWMAQRMNILRQLAGDAKDAGKEEL